MEPQNAIAVPVIIGLVEVAKRVGLPTRWLPLVAVALGLVYAYFTAEISWVDGLVFGLSSVGLFSGVRATVSKGEIK